MAVVVVEGVETEVIPSWSNVERTRIDLYCGNGIECFGTGGVAEDGFGGGLEVDGTVGEIGCLAGVFEEVSDVFDVHGATQFGAIENGFGKGVVIGVSHGSMIGFASGTLRSYGNGFGIVADGGVERGGCNPPSRVAHGADRADIEVVTCGGVEGCDGYGVGGGGEERALCGAMQVAMGTVLNLPLGGRGGVHPVESDGGGGGMGGEYVAWGDTGGYVVKGEIIKVGTPRTGRIGEVGFDGYVAPISSVGGEWYFK